MCCRTCGCLGLDSEPNFKWVNGLGFRFLDDTYREVFGTSARAGCRFCDLVYQGAGLLKSIESDPLLRIGIYSDRPAEIHAIPIKDDYDIVEICNSQYQKP
jgi:hypothetical protein